MIRWTILFVLASSGFLPAQEPQEKPAEKPSLAELARRNRDRKGKPGVRVITNADLKSLRANVSTSTSPQPADAPDEEATTAEEASEEGAEQAAADLTEEELEKWRKSLEEARQEVQSAVNEDMVLQLRMNNLRNAYLRQADGATQQRIQTQLQETLDQIQQSKQRQREARSALQNLQAEARAAGLTETQIAQFTGTVPGEPPNVLASETGDSDS